MSRLRSVLQWPRAVSWAMLARSSRHRSRESGYAMMLALAMAAAFIIGSQVVLRNLATQGRRQREQRTIWCGEQYVRAIKLYYRKTGHYPQSSDDLQTGLPGVHFLRIEAYKNPMDTEEGKWRYIYVNPANQIIGSVRYARLDQMAFLELNRMSPSQPGIPGLSSSKPASSEASDDDCGPPAPSAPEASDKDSTDKSSTGQPATGQLANPYAGLQPTGPVDGPVIGAFLTGVGGPTNEDRCSVKVVDGARKYKDWEFIWNPLLDQARATQGQINGATNGNNSSNTSNGNNNGNYSNTSH